ncbi:hypothetical protein SAMN05428959_102647 [Duganella sp. CF517]|uniref:hypothetical protein n=1 Tax=Duganella sp. CF517 TaxID=1881038 RepID=UPI0008B5B08F|nr:hypothetical protein [Duganella sp. CF517]SEN62232.1 hypothetical protein SAMN05428959_102647 [Duganella sp. CF517]
MAAASHLPGRISIAIATLSIVLATMLNLGVFNEDASYHAVRDADNFFRAVAVGFIGGIIGLGFAWQGLRRGGGKSWTNWIGLTLSLLPLLVIATFIVLIFSRR